MKGALLAALLAAALVGHAAAAAAPAVDGLCEGSGWEALDPEVRVDTRHNFQDNHAGIWRAALVLLFTAACTLYPCRSCRRSCSTSP